jgi:hypothetical protein
LFSAPQRDLEKNPNAVRKGLARNAQIRGVFGSPPSAEDFFGDARTSEWPVWAQNGKKWRTSSPYYVSLVRYSILVDTQRLECIISKQTSSKQHVLALGLCD